MNVAIIWDSRNAKNMEHGGQAGDHEQDCPLEAMISDALQELDRTSRLVYR
ncbi:hypothetical protein [Streptomonospora litoralis]|uniref:Uncharacterized protein n=1 Tax=Streptomonospora litoralis TaxID=2498135 RepID=A0A4V0ZK91_9ACTN|nr:hypothetical protein [Streptomonospora litoralis]QBI56162.1 hypothetical protein EKD16_22045 [Streptomonospora litoralis]